MVIFPDKEGICAEIAQTAVHTEWNVSARNFVQRQLNASQYEQCSSLSSETHRPRAAPSPHTLKSNSIPANGDLGRASISPYLAMYRPEHAFDP